MILGLYIHIPFCTKRCIYCDFYSIKTSPFKRKDDLFLAFTKALIQEIKLYKHQIADNIFSSVYVGGGTPSLLPVNCLDLLFSELFSTFQFDKGFEFSIETNPESINSGKLLCYKKWGVNRISLGCQTFNDSHLQTLGRNTTKKEIIDKYYLIREIGFDNINLDLIFGSVNQSYNDYIKDLECAVSLMPDHLSCYNLTQNRKMLSSRIEKGILKLPNEEIVLDEYLLTLNFLEKKGYYFYEVSSFAKKGKECFHNLLYWQQKEYLGLGPSACGTIHNKRYSNVPSLKQYFTLLNQNILPVGFSEQLDTDKLIKEKVMLSLRTKKGLNLVSLKDELTQSTFYSFQEKVNIYISTGFLSQKGDYITATKKGILLLDSLILNLV